MSRYIASDHAAFVDALRDCLGLAPLYGQKALESEWWHAAYLQQLSKQDGQTRKQVPT
jgi:hypothetical protein